MSVKLKVEEDRGTTLRASEAVKVPATRYKDLLDKPTINNTELYDNYNEIDPTVPAWAKGEEPREMTYSEIYELWRNVF